jgi:ribonuclease HII
MHLEAAALSKGFKQVAGVDEAGRGCLAGPVVAAAVILPARKRIRGVRDSKILVAAERERLAVLIRKRAVSIGVGLCSVEEIDRMNILRASLEAMLRAIHDLDPGPDYVLVDGNQPLPEPPCAFETVIEGDRLCHAIAAASIIAKVERDRIMANLDGQFPDFRLASNKGYGTPEHYDALEAVGPAACHRRSFKLKREHADQVELFPEPSS